VPLLLDQYLSEQLVPASETGKMLITAFVSELCEDHSAAVLPTVHAPILFFLIYFFPVTNKIS
jgi:hypothetical protein